MRLRRDHVRCSMRRGPGITIAPDVRCVRVNTVSHAQTRHSPTTLHRLPLTPIRLTMSKRPRSLSPNLGRSMSPPTKKTREDTKFLPNRIASAEAAAKVDRDPPLHKLMDLQNSGVKNVTKGDSIVYWMRIEDLRSASPVI